MSKYSKKPICYVTKIIVVVTLSTVFSSVSFGTETQTAKSANTGAGWGALAGLVFGGSLWDVAEGAVVGAAGGAAYGSLKGSEQQKIEKNNLAKAEAAQKIRLEQERNEILAQQKSDSIQTPDGGMLDRELLERAFGVDNVNGLYELRECKYQEAYIHALAGANSDKLSHRLSAIWLEALIAQDEGNASAAAHAYQQIVAQDDSVESIEEAQSETIDALVEIRSDRKAAGISC
jgi:hypothetical protein